MSLNHRLSRDILGANYEASFAEQSRRKDGG